MQLNLDTEYSLAELVGKLMDALAADLGQLKNQPDKPPRREQIKAQILELSKLYHQLKTGKDSSLYQR
jgi:hypothetical protein